MVVNVGTGGGMLVMPGAPPPQLASPKTKRKLRGHNTTRAW